MTSRFRRFALITLGLVLLLTPPLHSFAAARIAARSPRAVPTISSLNGGVQGFLERRGSGLAQVEVDSEHAGTLIEHITWYYNIEARIILALLETTSGLVSKASVNAVELDQPFGSGPHGFSAQIDWAAREVRAAFGPYDSDPVLTFSDGSTLTLSRSEDAHALAIKRFLAQGRTQDEWAALVARYPEVYAALFQDEPPAAAPSPPAATGFLSTPWLPGTRVIHSSYFDHVYPMVDDGGDGNEIMVGYTGETGRSYNGHDGHDYYFPDQPYGTPIIAAAPGWAYARTTRGLGVVIQHADAASGYESVYWHLEAFAPAFDELIDSSTPRWVERGELLGWSGATGFTDGAPHLHFEIRHNGKQVDPYGWYGAGDDPCTAFVRCEASTWLWDTSVPWQRPDAPTLPDTTPPTALLTLNPPANIRWLAQFEAGALSTVGPLAASTQLAFGPGRWGQAVRVNAAANLILPLSPTLDLAAGTLALWVKVPEHWSESVTGRHYLLASSANPADPAHIYSNTLALRHELEGPDGKPAWSFWTVDGAGMAQNLTAPDTLEPGWHHLAISWDQARGSKALFIDGSEQAVVHSAALPQTLGDRLQIGRWNLDAGESLVWLDEIVSYSGQLSPAALKQLALAEEPISASAASTSASSLLIEVPAADDSGGVVQVQLGIDGVYAMPLPYSRAYRWTLPLQEGDYAISVRLMDRLGNTTTVSQTISVDQPPQASISLVDSTPFTATLALTATDHNLPVEVALSAQPNPPYKVWEALMLERIWHWLPMQPRRVYAWFRDASGNQSGPYVVGPDLWRAYLPQVIR